MDFKEWMEKLRKSWFSSACVCVVVGLVLLLFPRIALDVSMYAISALIILFGAMRVFHYFQEPQQDHALFQSELITGLLSLGLGIFLITNVHSVETIVPMLFGILVMGFAIVNLQRALAAKNEGNSKWQIIMAIAVISGIVGVVILYNPFGALKTAVKIIGASLIFEGVSDLLSLKLLGRDFKRVRNE